MVSLQLTRGLAVLHHVFVGSKKVKLLFVERAAFAVDVVLLEVDPVVVHIAGAGHLEGKQVFAGPHSRVWVGRVAGVMISHRHPFRVFLVAFVEDHGTGKAQRIVGIVLGLYVFHDLVDHASKDRSALSPGKDLHLFLRPTLRPVVTDGRHGARIVQFLQWDEGHHVGVHVNAAAGPEGAESEKIGPVRGRSEAVVGVGGLDPAAFSDEFHRLGVAEVPVLVFGIAGGNTDLGRRRPVVAGDGIPHLGDGRLRKFFASRFVLPDEREVQVVLAHFLVRGVVDEFRVDGLADIRSIRVVGKRCFV